MRRASIVVAVIATFAVWVATPACASGSGHSSERAETVASPRTRGGSKCLDPAKINDAALSIGDVPTGFGEIPAPAPGTAIRLGGSDLSSERLPVPVAGGPVFHGFQQGTQSLIAGQYIGSSIVVLQNAKDAPKTIKAFRDAAAKAQTWDQPISDPVATATYTATPLSFGRFGDETFALRLATKVRLADSGTDVAGPTEDYVVFRSGNVLNVIVGGGGVDTTTYAKRSLDKITKLQKSCPRSKKNT